MSHSGRHDFGRHGVRRRPSHEPRDPGVIGDVDRGPFTTVEIPEAAVEPTVTIIVETHASDPDPHDGWVAGGDLSGTYPNPEVVDDSHSHTSATVPSGAGAGPLLLASDKASPIVFEDILQASDGNDFLYASEL